MDLTPTGRISLTDCILSLDARVMPQIDQKREQKKRQQEEERALELAEQRRIDREQAELQRKCAAITRHELSLRTRSGRLLVGHFCMCMVACAAGMKRSGATARLRCRRKRPAESRTRRRRHPSRPSQLVRARWGPAPAAATAVVQPALWEINRTEATSGAKARRTLRHRRPT